MVATDSYRLSVKETQLEAPLEGSFEANVPARALQELARIAQQAGAEALVGQRRAQPGRLRGRRSRAVLAPDRWSVPELSPAAARVGRARAAPSSAEFADVVRRVSLLAQKNAPLRLSFREGEVTVSAQTPDVGEASETLPVPFHGRAVRDRLQPGVPARRPGERRLGRPAHEAHQPAAPGPDRVGRRRRLRLPDHADQAQRVTVRGASRARRVARDGRCTGLSSHVGDRAPAARLPHLRPRRPAARRAG